MNYKTNEVGDVGVSNVKGEIKFIPKHLAEDHNLMKTQELTPVQEPVAEPKKRGPKPKDKIVG